MKMEEKVKAYVMVESVEAAEAAGFGGYDNCTILRNDALRQRGVWRSFILDRTSKLYFACCFLLMSYLLRYQRLHAVQSV